MENLMNKNLMINIKTIVKNFYKKINKKILIVIIAAFLVLLYLCKNILFTNETIFYAKKDNYQEKINLKGTIDTINSAEVYSKSSNMISSISVKEGDTVKSGDVIAYLDDDKTHEYEKADLNYKEATRNFEVSENLYNAGYLSKDNYIKAKSAMDLAKVTLDSLDIEDDLVIKSPIDGIVTKVEAKIGMVAGGLMAKKLFQIEDTSKLRVKVEIKEKDLHKVKIGQDACIVADAMGERVINGKLSYISSVGEASSNNNTKKVVEAFVDINEDEKDIIPGVSAKVDIIVNEHKDVLIIPIDCLIEEYDASYINILKNGKKKKTKINPLVVANDEFVIKNDGIISVKDKIIEVE